jgi:hypothetical protein
MADILTLREWFFTLAILSTLVAIVFLIRNRKSFAEVLFWWWNCLGAGALAILLFALFPRASAYPRLHEWIETLIGPLSWGVWFAFVLLGGWLYHGRSNQNLPGPGQASSDPEDHG